MDSCIALPAVYGLSLSSPHDSLREALDHPLRASAIYMDMSQADSRIWKSICWPPPLPLPCLWRPLRCSYLDCLVLSSANITITSRTGTSGEPFTDENHGRPLAEILLFFRRHRLLHPNAADSQARAQAAQSALPPTAATTTLHTHHQAPGRLHSL